MFVKVLDDFFLGGGVRLQLTGRLNSVVQIVMLILPTSDVASAEKPLD